MRNQYKLLSEKYEQVQEAAIDPAVETDYFEARDEIKKMMLWYRKQFTDFLEKHKVFYLVGKWSTGRKPPDPNDDYKDYYFYDNTKIEDPSILNKLLNKVISSFKSNNDTLVKYFDELAPKGAYVFFNLETAKKYQKYMVLTGPGSDDIEITKFILEEIMPIEDIYYKLFDDKGEIYYNTKKINDYLSKMYENNSVLAEINFMNIKKTAQGKEPNGGFYYTGDRKLIILSVKFLNKIALAKEENADDILKQAYQTLYHEYVHYGQHLIRTPPEQYKRPASLPDPGSPKYFNRPDEIMAHAANQANQLLLKYKTPQDAIRAFNQYMSQPDKQQELKDKGYTPEAKKKLFRYIVDYINLIASGADKVSQNPS